MSACGPLSEKSKRDELIQWSKKIVYGYYGEIKTIIERKDLISGRDLIAQGMESGPAMGRILKQIRDALDEALVLATEYGRNIKVC